MTCVQTAATLFPKVNLVLAQGKMEAPREILDSIHAAEMFVVAGCEEGVGCVGGRWHSSAPGMASKASCHRAASAPFLTGNVCVSTGNVFDGEKATELLLKSDFLCDADTECCEEMPVSLGRGR